MLEKYNLFFAVLNVGTSMKLEERLAELVPIRGTNWVPAFPISSPTPNGTHIWMIESKGRKLGTIEILEMIGIDAVENLDYSPNQRPYLRWEESVDFNISNVKGAALIGFSESQRIGVDLERLEKSRFREGMLGTHYTKSEVSRISVLEGEEKMSSMARIWVSKEAIVKCIDIPIKFSELEIPLLDRGENRVIVMDNGSSENYELSLYILDLPNGWVGSFALSSR